MRSAILSRPTFLESFEPHAHINQGRGTSPSIIGTSGISALSQTQNYFSSQSSAHVALQQVQHYTYWNYVGIRLICDRASEPFPMLSYTSSRPAPGADSPQSPRSRRQSHITLNQRHWLQQKYGWLQSAQEDLEPLPENHAFCELLNNPNPEDTWNEFAFEHFLFLNLTGRTYWWVVPNGFGVPVQMAVIPTQWMRPERDRDGNYVVELCGTTQGNLVLPPDQVIESKLKSPQNKRDGYSGIAAAPRWTENVENIERSRHHSFTNGANPDLLIMLGEKYADPTDDVLTRIKEKFLRRAGGVSRAGEPLVAPPDVTVEKWSHAPKEMDYTTSGDQTRDNNLALHNVPKVLAGITTDVNRATVEAAEVIFCSSKINPQLRHFAGTLTWLARRFDTRIRVWYQDVTPKNAQQELLEDQADFAMGAMTPDERRQKRGRETIGEPAYESGYVAAGLHPLAEELNQPEPGVDPETGLPIEEPIDDTGDGEGNDASDDDKNMKPKAKPKKPAGKSGKKPVKQSVSSFATDDFDRWDLGDEDPLDQ